MRREDGFERREDEPTRPVRVPRLSPNIRNDTSRIIRVDLAMSRSAASRADDQAQPEPRRAFLALPHDEPLAHQPLEARRAMLDELAGVDRHRAG